MNKEKTAPRSDFICMVGTDHGMASVDVRSAFALPADSRDAGLPVARVNMGASGVVLLATCNRTELWVSFDGVDMPERHVAEDGTPLPDDPIFQAFCALHNVKPSEYARYFACRSGGGAVSHLFHVACGLRSAIMAEDQIVSQVKQAIAISRELGVGDSCLEVLFRQAVTAAKQVKSGVRFTRAYATAVDQAVSKLEEDGTDFPNTTCMVIGNGEYGRLAASTLEARGARVMVTVRQYTHGTVKVPRGCTGIPYTQRYEYLNDCDVVMSATTSPHYTLKLQDFRDAWKGGHQLALFDLAIPRDIDPQIGDVAECDYWDIDSFATEIGTENTQAIVAAQRLLNAGMSEFWDWVDRRETMAHVRPPAPSLFPLFVDLSDKRAVFIGGGTIALRRVRTILPFVGDLVVYAPDFSPELERFAADGALTLVNATYDESMLEGADIVFACTNQPDLNDRVSEACKERGILVNVCSDRYKCDFFFPGVVQHENVVVGVSAAGKDHRRVRQLSARIKRLMDEEDV